MIAHESRIRRDFTPSARSPAGVATRQGQHPHLRTLDSDTARGSVIAYKNAQVTSSQKKFQKSCLKSSVFDTYAT